VKGVELYVSDFQRPLTERIAKDFFSDPAQSAVTCVRTGPVTLDPSINKSPEGEEARVHPRPPAPSLRTALPPLRPPPRDAIGIAIGAVCVAQVFSQARALLFKAVKVRATRQTTATDLPPAAVMRAHAQVRRVYDEKTNSLLYISYAERLDKSDDENKSRFKTSMCVLPAN